MTAKVILNPYSNRWKAKERWGQAEAALNAAGIEFDLSVTERPLHAAELAEDAARRGLFPVICAGGDGTIDEIVNGLARVQTDGPLGPLGFLPLGTGNDYMFSLGLPTDLESAAQVIARGKIGLTDLGSLNGKFFANNSAIGLEPYVNVKQETLTWMRGVVRYLVAALMAINDNKQWYAHIDWDGGSYEGPLTLLTVGNGRRTGGIFFLTPHADPMDGLFDCVIGYRSSRWSTLQLLPQTMNPDGKFLSAEGIHEIRATKIEIVLDNTAPAHTDGELFKTWERKFDYQMYPGRLKVIVP